MTIHCVMECGLHVTHWNSTYQAPGVGEFILCPACRSYKHVAVRVLGVRVRCRDCTYSVKMGEAKIAADLKAIAHVHKYPSHAVEVRRDLEYWRRSPLTEAQLIDALKEWRKIHVFRNDSPQLALGGNDDPPF